MHVTALRHVPFEDLGAFAPALSVRLRRYAYFDVGADDLATFDPLAPDLLIVLGGPIGVYEEDRYPFIAEELRVIRRRLSAGRPIMGICFGAQLIAAAMDARVYPSGGKEIGFAPITLTPAGRASCLAPFADDPIALHWHGDTFDLPEGATLLASTPACVNQAFSAGPNVIAFQFHPEGGGAFERWLIGHPMRFPAPASTSTAYAPITPFTGSASRKRRTRCWARGWSRSSHEHHDLRHQDLRHDEEGARLA